MKSIWKLKAYFDKFVEWLLFLVILAMCVLVTWQVISRYLLNAPSTWSEECARYCMVWMAMLGCAVAMKWGMHMSLTLVVDRFRSIPVKKVVLCLGYLGCLILSFVMVKYGYAFALAGLVKRAASIKLKMIWVNAAIPVGGLCLILNILECAYRVVFENKLPDGTVLEERG